RSLVISRAIGSDIDLACGAIEQAHSKPRFQLLDELRHAGPVHVQRGCGLGEAAGFYDPSKSLHCIKTVHFRPRAGGIVWILQTILTRIADLSRLQVFLQWLHQQRAAMAPMETCP